MLMKLKLEVFVEKFPPRYWKKGDLELGTKKVSWM